MTLQMTIHNMTLQMSIHIITCPPRSKASSLVQACCSTMQSVAMSCSVMQCVAVYNGVCPPQSRVSRCIRPHVAACCSTMQSVAERCSVLQYDAIACNVMQSVAVCCSALQCVAVRCSMSQWRTCPPHIKAPSPVHAQRRGLPPSNRRIRAKIHCAVAHHHIRRTQLTVHRARHMCGGGGGGCGERGEGRGLGPIVGSAEGCISVCISA